MYLTSLRLNPRSSQVQTEVANAYEMHRTLMRAFPGSSAGGPGRVLFRFEDDRYSRGLIVLVQSAKKPDWSFFQNDREYLDPLADNPCESKEFNPRFVARQRLSFRLRGNPTVKRNGRRLGLRKEEEQVGWLDRKAGEGGFRVLACRITPKGLQKPAKILGKDWTQELTFLATIYEGVLEVTDPERFGKTLASGVGSGKGLGFGMVSIAPVRDEA